MDLEQVLCCLIGKETVIMMEQKEKDKIILSLLDIKLMKEHTFNFLLTGAPQYHDQNFTKAIS